MHPRTLIQVTLQITHEPATKFRKTTADISTLPALLNAAFVALVDGGFPLATTMSAVLAVVTATGEATISPNENAIKKSSSIHAFAFGKHGEQLLAQSAGRFDLDTWERVAGAAQEASAAAIAPAGEDAVMMNGVAQGEAWLRQTIQDQAEAANAWRGAP
jgi:exosome complex component RRP46